MVTGGFSHDDVGPVVVVKGIMNGNYYVDLMKTHMLLHAKAKMCHGWIFQQDYDPKPISNVTKKLFSTNKVLVLE